VSFYRNKETVMSRTWLPKLWKQTIGSTTRSRPPCRKPRHTRPCVEPLENRTTPTTLPPVMYSYDAPVYFGPTGQLLPINVGTLRYEATQANIDAAHGISDTIQFSSSLNGKPITLTRQLELSGVGGVITIAGNGQLETIIQLNNPNYLLQRGRVFQVDLGVHAQLGYMTIQGGQAYLDSGGAIWNAGTLQIAHCYVQHNDAYTGGAIYNSGGLTMAGCYVYSNVATSGGAGIANWGAFTVTGSIIANNLATGSGSWGGGIENHDTATISSCSISANSAQRDGGGIFNEAQLNVLNNTYVNGNTAPYGGGIYTEGNATVTASVITANTASAEGGGILNTVALTVNGGSWVENNSAGSYGGGIYNASTTIVDDSTLYNNRAGWGGGGGIANGGTLYVWDGAVIESNGAYFGGGIDNGGTVWLNLNPMAPYSTSAPHQFSQAVYLEANHVAEYGGGIYNAGTTTMYNTIVEQNGSGSNGGGIYSNGTLTVGSSVIESNTAYGDGGGLYNSGVAAVVNFSTFTYNGANTGAGIDNLHVLTVANSAVEYNHANWNGGGIANWATSDILGSTFENNSAGNDGGGIYTNSPDTIRVWLPGYGSDTFEYDHANNVAGGFYNGGAWVFGIGTLNFVRGTNSAAYLPNISDAADFLFF
jgi:predicted outer membrane repeat protein